MSAPVKIGDRLMHRFREKTEAVECMVRVIRGPVAGMYESSQMARVETVYEERICDEWVPLEQVADQVALFRAGVAASYQDRVRDWILACFNGDILADAEERGDRFLEEVFELLQALGYDENRIDRLKRYVYDREPGEPRQEVGGVMVTLAGLCACHGLDMHQDGETELARVWTKIDLIREKQKAKPQGSPLPVAEV